MKNPFEGDAHGWIQWKGPKVCMDLHCPCGARGHIDGMFAYYVKCGNCGRKFELNGYLKMVELPKDYNFNLDPFIFNDEEASIRKDEI